MSHRRVEASAAGSWFARGWQLFTRSAGIWIVAALLFAAINFVLSLIPLLGTLVSALLAPALFGGLVYGARELDRDRPLEVAHLFQAFRAPGRAAPMLMLGLVPLAAVVLGVIVGVAVMAGAAGAADMGPGAHGPGTGMVAGGGGIVVLFAVLIGLVAGALLLFSVPRVMLGAAEPMAAVQESLRAVLDNIGAYVVFAVLYGVLAILAAIPFGLGFLLLVPVMAGAVHAACVQVFGEQAGDAPAGGDAEDAGPQ